MPDIRGYLPEGLDLLTAAVEAISAPYNRSMFMFPEEIKLEGPNGEPYGTLVWQNSAYTYRFYPAAERVRDA